VLEWVDGVVTELAVVGHPFLPDMVLVTEDNRAGIVGGEGVIL
jgi:hypothetical protein